MKDATLFYVMNLSCVREQRLLFTDISFALNPGNALFIEGPNGSGKSSLLRLLAGLATPYCGDIFWQGQSLQENNIGFQEQIHYIGHSNGIKLGLTVNENLQLIAKLNNSTSINYDEVLKQLQLSDRGYTLAKNLSAGQRRRLALARLFLFPKQLWLLDEPLTALDVATQAIFLMQLEVHLQQGGMVIASSHQPIAINRATQILRLEIC